MILQGTGKGKMFLGVNIYFPDLSDAKGLVGDELDIEALIAWRIRVADRDQEWTERPSKDVKRTWIIECYLRDLATSLEIVTKKIQTFVQENAVLNKERSGD